MNRAYVNISICAPFVLSLAFVYRPFVASAQSSYAKAAVESFIVESVFVWFLHTVRLGREPVLQ